MLESLKKLYYTDPNVLSTIFKNNSEIDNHNYDDEDDEYEDDDLADSYLLHQDTVLSYCSQAPF